MELSVIKLWRISDCPTVWRMAVWRDYIIWEEQDKTLSTPNVLKKNLALSSNVSKIKFGLSVYFMTMSIKVCRYSNGFQSKTFFFSFLFWKKPGTKVYMCTSIDQLICKKSSLMWICVTRAADSRTVFQNKHERNTKIKITSALCRWTNKIWKTTRQAGKGHKNFNTMWEYVSIEMFWDLTNSFCPQIPTWDAWPHGN